MEENIYELYVSYISKIYKALLQLYDKKTTQFEMVKVVQ
jgi:hypothetical protein